MDGSMRRTDKMYIISVSLLFVLPLSLVIRYETWYTVYGFCSSCILFDFNRIKCQ